jgi:DNA repair photolyase
VFCVFVYCARRDFCFAPRREVAAGWIFARASVTIKSMITITERKTADIITKTKIPAGDYVVNPYIGCPHKCLYCYADYMRRFTNHSEKWGDFLDVKRCSKKINVKRFENKEVIFSSATDAYNPFEKKYRVTREILEQFAYSNVKITILTKSDLLLRDIDLFKCIPHIQAGVSLNTLDDSVRKDLEPRAASIDKRIDAVKTLHDNGIRTHVFLSPMFPGITNFKKIIERCKPFTDEFWFENLNLRGSFRPAVMRYIYNNHKNLIALYDDIYKFKHNDYWRGIKKEIAQFCKDNAIQYKDYFYHEKIKK